MKLKDYMNSMDLSARKRFSESVGTTWGHLRNVMYGYKPASIELAIAVHHRSKGVVEYSSVAPQYDWPLMRKVLAGS